MSWFVYLAKSKTKRYYTGITTNAEERILEHNSGKGSRFAKQQGPFNLVYLSMSFPNKSAARKREVQIKGWTREKKERIIRGEWE
ncbi:MAG: GIY-YIG nuclease family protein [Patescibacteria group bacterium]